MDTITLERPCPIARLERTGRLSAAAAGALRSIRAGYSDTTIPPDPAFINWASRAIRERFICAVPFSHADIVRDVLIYHLPLHRFEAEHRLRYGQGLEALRQVAAGWLDGETENG